MIDMDIEIGPKIEGGGSAVIQAGYHDVNLYLGGLRKSHDSEVMLTARYRMHDINVYVTDQEIVQRIAKSVKAGDRQETLKILTKVFIENAAKDADFFKNFAKFNFELGVAKGRSDKAKELRKVLDSN